MRRADTTTAEHQAAWRGKHSAGIGKTGADHEWYIRCGCGWRVIYKVQRKAEGIAAKDAFNAHAAAFNLYGGQVASR